MGYDIVTFLGKETVTITLIMIAPLIGTALVVGLAIGIFQAVTSIQEQTLTFLPKLLAVFGVFALSLPWLLDKITSFATLLLGDLSKYTF
ncbi:MAG: flagellar biosynthesis protein FliQ [Candidatus Scalindua rubra]|uniref:Flagellar biosynthetic protein FliQ n=1 Tax=Candidatus Scalindua brodae TaxID=237368 RepID=A0A0B0EU66_9BACT|nr:MAG: flagellar biosynthetic protein FliQ [Candidatus Scalindua brodae]MBZ0107217.1 flagellar biosynthesis protein FliQ [Candidatus Scalindua rubra]TWU31656.1 Flagellar biosynthetic protein FliQ [Candidatus Brocadiaceae bacterium S225]